MGAYTYLHRAALQLDTCGPLAEREPAHVDGAARGAVCQRQHQHEAPPSRQLEWAWDGGSERRSNGGVGFPTVGERWSGYRVSGGGNSIQFGCFGLSSGH